jgi:hypothetical protein
MTISDAMSDAKEAILGYLEEPAYDDWYGSDEVRRRIAEVIVAMDRTMDKLNYPPEPLPDDPLNYLNDILKERAKEAEGSTLTPLNVTYETREPQLLDLHIVNEVREPQLLDLHIIQPK